MSDEGVYGSGDLWVDAWFARQGPNASIQHGRAVVKWGTFTLYGGRLSEHGGPPHVKAARLNGTGTASTSPEEDNYATATSDDGTPYGFWPTVVEFPDFGCWRVTVTHGPDTVAFTARVTRPPS
ncbi:hypothetical protein E1293_07270 [Actinomadura darangshiensis]|uniref:Uncharacterized protein n=1 Tax=Actinomadura darangshiensis TaxID=705336 RepID=A0A4R5BQU7_9ACTN|nr:hypothetical protein E1293_07270 [Actinomadura darangshiensis]